MGSSKNNNYSLPLLEIYTVQISPNIQEIKGLRKKINTDFTELMNFQVKERILVKGVRFVLKPCFNAFY